MAVDRVKFQDILSSQLPRYVREDFPLLTEFLEQYYVSQEYKSGPIDIANNIDQYVKVEELTNLVDSTILQRDLDIGSFDPEILVTSTVGFSDTYGIIKIDDEIILYESKTSNTFQNCTRGFSGITTYITTGKPNELTFEQTEVNSHSTGAVVENLNILFLKQFLIKLKKQFTPGFSERSFFEGLDAKNFIYNAKSFYGSKGSNQSYEILFRALYGEDVEVILPSKFLFTPSNANYKVTKDFVVERLQGNPLDLKNLTIFQNRTNARGSVSNVQQIPYENFQYFQISIDSGFQRDSDVNGSIFGEFKPNPLTKVLDTISIGATVINVDSTIDFPDFGNLITRDIDDNEISIAYSGKTVNQFFNVENVTNSVNKKTDIKLDSFSYAYVGIDTSKEIKVRFTSTLKDFIQNDPTSYFKKNDTIEIKSLGYEAPGKKNNDYILNVKTKYKIETSEVIDQDLNIYQFTLFNKVFFKEGYLVRYENEDSTISILGTVTRVSSPNNINVSFNEEIPTIGEFFLENQLLKGSSTKYPFLSNFAANIQNTYAKFDGSLIIASNSIPKYNNVQTNTYDKKITFSTSLLSTNVLTLPTNPTTIPDHGFYTGDAVYFESNGNGFQEINSGTYFVHRIDGDSINLSRSKGDLSKENYIIFNGSVENATISLLEFYQKTIQPQGIYRKILEPVKKENIFETEFGYTGIFLNGLELLNYKSSNSVYYGDILNFTITNGGSGYDVINPPVLNIQDEVGTGATGSCNVIGNIVRIDVTDPGRYNEVPTIKITGGNGSGATAVARTRPEKRVNKFVANFPSNVDLVNNRIIFDEPHRLTDGERLIYEPGKTKIISGLSTNAGYFCFVTTESEISLHNTKSDGLVGLNTVVLEDFGDGLQKFTSADSKLVVSSIVVTNPGVGYENKKRSIPQFGINTASNQVEIKNHGYESKEIVRYQRDPNKIRVRDLSQDTDYYVVKINDDAFSLTEVGVGTTSKDFYFDNNIIIDFKTIGRGSFNYKPIEIKTEGGEPVVFNKTFTSDFDELFLIESPVDENIITPENVLAFSENEVIILTDEFAPPEDHDFFVQVSDDSEFLIAAEPFIGNDLSFDAKLQPVVRGSIESIDLTNGGKRYGSQSIIDFLRQPDVTFESGSGAKITPIINNGKITEVIINSPGSNYNCPPDIQIVSETGNFAILVPIIKNGVLDSVIVQSGGLGYQTGKTFLNVISTGIGAQVTAGIRPWNVNLFERNFANILNDDSIVETNIVNESLQLSALYAPRPLRSSLNVISGFSKDNLKYGIFDLTLNESGEEESNTFHSPIVGWAYDGNPIYGPYGFKNVDGTGGIKRMVSGYQLTDNFKNRPSFDSFPNGFFTNDYEFTGNGDLDESNGRFCVTPDFPNGIYAYFCTISDSVDSTGPFKNFRRPLFPYVIGNEFRSVPEQFNFLGTSNQTDFDIVSEDYFRNTTYYFTNGGNSEYDYIFNSDRLINQSLDVTATSDGIVDGLDIINSGDNYAVGDQVNFDSSGTFGRNLNYQVSVIEGKLVDNVSLATTFFNDVEFSSIFNNNSFVGFTTIPHNLLPRDTIFIDNISPYYKNFAGPYSVGISSQTWLLPVGLKTNTTTGIVTYVSVSGPLDRNVIRSNDVLKIEDEKVKVLNIDKESSRIRILREIDNTVGVAHSSGTIVREDPRKFSFVSNIDEEKNLTTNNQFYFIPSESLGIGTETVGTATTITFSNPGLGATQIRLNQQQILIPDNQLSLNTPIIYSTNGGTSILVWSGVEGTPFYNLEQTKNLFAIPLSKDIIGISSQKVGLNSEGIYVGTDNNAGGLLYFVNSGVGDIHSFNTNISDVLTGRISNNVVKVSTAQTHGLTRGDRVFIDVNPTTTTTIKVKYDDPNRRIVFDPDNIEVSGINTSTNTIQVPKNKYRTGDKIIYDSSDPSENLESSGLYFVYVLQNNLIKLVEESFELSKQNPTFVNIGSAKSCTISRINPQILVEKNQNIKFDLSDSSLSFDFGSSRFSAFDMFIYNDSQKINKFFTTGTTRNFEVTKSGKIGIDTDAFLNLKISDNIPEFLYYGFSPDNLNIIPRVKLEIYDDDSVINNNSITLDSNKFDGNYSVVGVTSNTFEYNIPFDSDNIELYNSTNSNVNYKTNSLTAEGPVSSFRGISKGNGYRSLPGFTTITSKNGSGALIEPFSSSIGTVLNTRINNIGFGYPTDNTLNIVANLPQVLKVNPLGEFESIGITSSGINYSKSPDLVVLDGVTDEVVNAILTYEIGDTEVTILQNTNDLNNVPPKFIPTNNTNGFNIKEITYNDNTNIVRIEFTNQFSDEKDFPFKVGESVLVENVASGTDNSGKGYNSEDYGYTLFEVTSLDSQLGGGGAYIEYDLTDLLEPNESPGEITSLSAASVTPEIFFPTFNTVIKTSEFFKDEKVTNPDGLGIVERFDPVSGFLYVTSEDDFEIGTVITSITSGNKALIVDSKDFNATVKLGAGATVIDGFQTNSGFLNDNLQVLPNNEYYQNFSYSLKSRVPFGKWEDSVSSLNHIAGFRKFGDLVIDNDAVGIVSVADIEVETVVDLISNESLYCFPDFDNVSERTIDISDSLVVSNEIIFDNTILIDFFESRGNRVLRIDDFSDQFNSDARSTRFSVVDIFDNRYKWNKIFTLVQDNELRNKKQFSIVTVLQDESIGYTNEYGTIDTGSELGSFSYIGVGSSEWGLTFFPDLFEFNNYQISYFSFSGDDIITDVGSRDIGDIISIGSSSLTVPVSTETNLIQIPTSKRSAKLHIQLQTEDQEYFYTELNILHNDTDVELLQYGNLDSTSGITDGFGSFTANISGGNVNVNIIPNVGTALSANILSIETDATATGFSTTNLVVTDLSSYYKSIPSSSNPAPQVIASYEDPYASEYFMVTVHDTTNDEFEMFECHVIDSDNLSIVKYGRIFTFVGLGTVGVSKSNDTVNLVYTPIQDIAVDVRAFGISLKNFNDTSGITSISDLNNNILFSDFGTYTGTEFDKKTQFNLESGGLSIFERQFSGNDASIVNVTNNQITIPNHYFVTGEKVNYTYENSKFTSENAINITSTVIGGISTDKLPKELYVVKFSNTSVGFAKNATDALSSSPTLLDFTSVGVGTLHKITATNQDAKALVAIDNIIQAPLTEVNVSTTLDQNIVFDAGFLVTGIQSFRSNDIIKIDDELMKIQDIGVGATNKFRVLRGRLGSAVSAHSAGTEIQLIGGNYTITENTINFVDAPQGPTPIGTTTGDPDDRDYVGLTTFSTFQGRTFIRSGVPDSSVDTYSTNYTFDNIQSQFNGQEKTFTLFSEGQNIAGFSTQQAIILNSNVLQEPQGIQLGGGDFELIEEVGVTSITYLGDNISSGDDPNKADIPRGGSIISVGSSSGFGYQPLRTAGATCTVGLDGRISSVSIGNTGSGYRVGIQTVNVGYTLSSVGISTVVNIGTATIESGGVTSVNITNTGENLDINNPPLIVIDSPLPYSNIPLIYPDGQSGQGVGAKVDITVGQGSSVIDFNIVSGGFGYGNGEVLTVAIGGASGIPTTSNPNFEEFKIIVDNVFRDSFNGFTVGELAVFDKLDDLFDGNETSFPLKISGSQFAIEVKKGSGIDITQNLIITINDILQVPNESYKFNGGSILEFTEPPKKGDTSKIIFYKGTPDIDVVFVDIIETVKIGDTLQLKNDASIGQKFSLFQEQRTVTGITTLDTVTTFPYSGPGITKDKNLLRPVTWCKQTTDISVNGKFVTKDRVSQEPSIFPAAYLTTFVGISSVDAYFDTVRPLFDSKRETTDEKYQEEVTFTDQTEIESAEAIAFRTSSSVSNITLTNGGKGYSNLNPPNVYISSPDTITGVQATAEAVVTGDSVTSITITDGGSGYKSKPLVLIDQPTISREDIKVSSFSGDQGSIVGYALSASGIVTLELYIPEYSFLRDPNVTGTAVTISQLNTNDTFVVNLSNVDLFGEGDIDGIYQVSTAYDQSRDLSNIGLGVTTIRRVEFNSSSSGSGVFRNERIYGEYTWGKVEFLNRNTNNAKEFTPNSYQGITSSPLIQRTNPLKFNNYLS
jgi:hypothetical protein